MNILERSLLVLAALTVRCIVLDQANAQFIQQGSKLIGTGAVGSAQQGFSAWGIGVGPWQVVVV